MADIRVRKLGRRAVAVAGLLGVGVGVVGPGRGEGVNSLTGECGADNVYTTNTGSVGISANAGLSISQSSTTTFGPARRKARFRFFGTQSGGNNHWSYYQYRLAVVSGYDFGPQSDEEVRFGRDRDDWDNAYWRSYHSPDNHNSNVPGSAPTQALPPNYITAIGDSDIWVKTWFDIPSQNDPECYTHAVQVLK